MPTPPAVPTPPAAPGAPTPAAPRPAARRTAGTGAAADLVERDDELRAVDAAVERVTAGEGGVVLFEGPAGIGKTRLLGELRDRAATRDALVLEAARAGLLEREFGFGVVRQLLEPVADPSLLEGPAAAARAVLSDAGTTEGTFPILNGLFRLVERLAASAAAGAVHRRSAVERPGLAALRRVSGPPDRRAARCSSPPRSAPASPTPTRRCSASWRRSPSRSRCTPRPLTADATRRLVRLRLGGDADAAFSAACHEVTAGNPLLLRPAAERARRRGGQPRPRRRPPRCATSARSRSPARCCCASRRLPEPAVAVARAVAVLGEQPGLPAVAALAGADEPAAAGAIQALARAEILRGDESLGFVHPLIRDAVYSEFTAPARALEHARAARLLAELGASPERVAAQLLLTTPRGDPWVVARLREAAQVALRRGAPDAAMRLLERAQAEPPPRRRAGCPGLRARWQRRLRARARRASSRWSGPTPS